MIIYGWQPKLPSHALSPRGPPVLAQELRVVEDRLKNWPPGWQQSWTHGPPNEVRMTSLRAMMGYALQNSVDHLTAQSCSGL